MAASIGITGNIGSGKTTVCREFSRLGVPVYYADVRAKALMTEDEALVTSIRKEFGDRSYESSGQLNRGFLADSVFGNSEALAKLNGLVHPAVARDALTWVASQDAVYTLHEAAIIFEIGSQDRYDDVVVVACPREVRRQRVLARGGIDARGFEERDSRQWTDQRKEGAADHLIHNGGKQLLLPQVLALHRNFMRAFS